MFTKLRRYMHEGALHTALQKQAEAIGEREKHSALCKHYRLQAAAIDPTKDHWGYATARDSELSHEAAAKAQQDMVRILAQRVHDLQLKLNTLPAVRTERPWFLFVRRTAVSA